MIGFACHKWVIPHCKTHGGRVAARAAVGIACFGVLLWAFTQVRARTQKDSLAFAQRSQEHAIITNIPSQLNELKAKNSRPPVLIVQPNSPKVVGEGFRVQTDFRKLTLIFGSCQGIFKVDPIREEDAGILLRPHMPIGGIRELVDQMNFTLTRDGLFCDFEWAPRFGTPALKLKHNELSGLPSDWDCNHTDSALEIVNAEIKPFAQIIFKSGTTLIFNGVFMTTNGCYLASEGGAVIGNNGGTNDIANTINADVFKEQFQRTHLSRLFKYPSWKYPGVFAE